MSVNAVDDLKITTSTAQTENIIGAVSVQNPVSDNWRSVVIKGEYSGSPAHNNTEELPGDASWKATASCDDLDFKDNKKTCDWQTDSELKFFVKSTTPKKYTITISITLRVAIHKKNSDGTKGEFLRNSPEIELSVERNVWIVGIGDVKAKPKGSDDTSYITAPSEVVGLVGSSHMFKAIPEPSNAPGWPSGKPVWKLGADSIVSVSSYTEIHGIGSATLMLECGNTKTFTITNIKPTLESVDFKDGGVQTIKDVGTEPEWKKANDRGQGGRNEPFCVVKNCSFNFVATITLSKNLTFQTTVMMCERDDAKTSATNLTLQNGSVNLTRTRMTPDKVSTGIDAYTWPYSVNNGQQWYSCTNTEHIAYSTWGQKLCSDTDFTKAHIHYACSTANGATTLAEIGNMIGPDAVGNARFNLEDHHTSNPWTIIDTNVRSDCVSLCYLMKSAIQLLGDDSAEVWYVYACNASWNSLASQNGYANERCIAHNGIHPLAFWNGGYNGFEACCRLQGKWWMGGLGISKQHPLEVLRAVTSPNTVNGHTTNATHHQCSCVHPVPYPASTGGIIPAMNSVPPSYPPAIPNF